MRKDGGAAFPIIHSGARAMADVGMSLRDYFAGAALQGMLADPNVKADNEESLSFMAEKWAEHSYVIADAMLKAREAEE